MTTKEDLIDVLLDFLGDPDVSLLKQSNTPNKKKKVKTNKKKSTSSQEKEVDKEDEEDEVHSDVDDMDDDDGENDDDYDGMTRTTTATATAGNTNVLLAVEGKKDEHNVSVAALRRWVKAYVACFNMDKATVKHAIETASDKFGVNLASKKDILKLLLTEEL